MEFSYLETLAKIFIIPATENQFNQKRLFIDAPVGRIVFAMNTTSVFTGSYTKNPIWYQQFHPKQIKILRGGQPIVVFDTADNYRLYVTTRKAMKFQDDFPSISIYNFRDRYVLVIDLTSM